MGESAVKLIGAIIILSSSLYYGQMKISTEKNRLKLVSSLAELVKFIGERIEHFTEPLPEILSEYKSEYLEKIGFLSILKKDGIHTLREKVTSHGSGEEAEIIDVFASKIGKSYKDEELALCRYTHDKLQEIESRIMGSMKDKEKLYRTIPPMLALSVILILM